MNYPKSYVSEAQQIIDDRKNKNGYMLDLRYEEIKSKLPLAKKYIEDMAETINKVAQLIVARDERIREKIEVIEKENLDIQKALEEELIKNGYPADYLNPIYTCEICCDTGRDGIKRCECFNSVLKQLAGKKLSEQMPVGLMSFDTFDMRYYSDVPRTELKGKSAKFIMQQNFDYCRSYAENFHLPCDGIFMMGGTGLGKTHLSLSIAREVSDKGFSVVYGSVPDLIRKIKDESFGQSDEEGEVLETIKECDLLVLDDLGAEHDTKYNTSNLYEIINSRINNRRPTIVSTNFSISEIRERYSDRIASRLLSMKCMVFSGDDIRMALKQNK